jgi:hypothetical protein
VGAHDIALKPVDGCSDHWPPNRGVGRPPLDGLHGVTACGGVRSEANMARADCRAQWNNHGFDQIVS